MHTFPETRRLEVRLLLAAVNTTRAIFNSAVNIFGRTETEIYGQVLLRLRARQLECVCLRFSTDPQYQLRVLKCKLTTCSKIQRLLSPMRQAFGPAIRICI